MSIKGYFSRFVIATAAMAIMTAAAWAVVGEILTVQVRETPMRSAPSFTGPPAGQLSYGQTVSVLEEQGVWVKAQGAGGTGWVHASALTGKRLSLVAGAGDVASRADEREVAAAGKGFNAETERAYRQGHPDGYGQVEAMLRFQYDPERLQAFLAAGQLVPAKAVMP